jgi:hypothetical protein
MDITLGIHGASYINGAQAIGDDLQHTYIIIPIDDLSIGVHNFSLLFANPGESGGIVTDAVLVAVQLSPTVFLIGGAGIGVLLLVSVALFIRSKR